MKAIPCEKLPRNGRSRTMLCTTPFTEQRKLAQTRIERGEGGPGAQLSKRTSTLYSKILQNMHPVCNIALVISNPAKNVAKQLTICPEYRVGKSNTTHYGVRLFIFSIIVFTQIKSNVIGHIHMVSRC